MQSNFLGYVRFNESHIYPIPLVGDIHPVKIDVSQAQTPSVSPASNTGLRNQSISLRMAIKFPMTLSAGIQRINRVRGSGEDEEKPDDNDFGENGENGEFDEDEDPEEEADDDESDEDLIGGEDGGDGNLKLGYEEDEDADEFDNDEDEFEEGDDEFDENDDEFDDDDFDNDEDEDDEIDA